MLLCWCCVVGEGVVVLLVLVKVFVERGSRRGGGGDGGWVGWVWVGMVEIGWGWLRWPVSGDGQVGTGHLPQAAAGRIHFPQNSPNPPPPSSRTHHAPARRTHVRHTRAPHTCERRTCAKRMISAFSTAAPARICLGTNARTRWRTQHGAAQRQATGSSNSQRLSKMLETRLRRCKSHASPAPTSCNHDHLPNALIQLHLARCRHIEHSQSPSLP